MAEHPANNGNGPLEDPRTFWERSNARLGVEAGLDDPSGRRKGRGPVEYPCSVCGTMVMLDRWPKHRHEVRCEPCKQTVSSLLDDDDLDVGPQRSGHELSTRSSGHARLEGLPEMTAEDLEALAELRATRSGDLGPIIKGAATGGRRRRRTTGGPPNGRPEGNGDGQRRRHGPPEAAVASEKPEGSGGGRRKRRRRRGDAVADPAPAGSEG